MRKIVGIERIQMGPATVHGDLTVLSSVLEALDEQTRKKGFEKALNRRPSIS